MMTIICKHCGKEFIPTHHSQKYCPECKKISYYWRNHEKELNRMRKLRKRKPKKVRLRICPICHGVFQVDKHHHVYCGDECRKEGQRRKAKEWRQARIDAIYMEFLIAGYRFPESVPF